MKARPLKTVRPPKKSTADTTITAQETASAKIQSPYPQLKKLSEKEATSPLHNIGKTIQGKGIYVGAQSLIYLKNTSSGYEGKEEHASKIIDLYAAPEDLKNAQGYSSRLSFNEAAEYISTLKPLHGHNVKFFQNQFLLKDAFENGSYAGEWFIPTQTMLADLLYPNRFNGGLDGSFRTKLVFSPAQHSRYWSCTKHTDHKSHRFYVDFNDGYEGHEHKENLDARMPIRLVRAEIK